MRRFPRRFGSGVMGEICFQRPFHAIAAFFCTTSIPRKTHAEYLMNYNHTIRMEKCDGHTSGVSDGTSSGL